MKALLPCLLAGLYDSQVQNWAPAKWVAKLRALKTDDNLLILRTRMDSGHATKPTVSEPRNTPS
jgi:oligopeptidase B